MNDKNQQQGPEKGEKKPEKDPKTAGVVVTTKNGGRAQDVPSKHTPRTR